MLYFEEPDTAAHAFGPESVQVLNYIQKVLIHLFIYIFICSGAWGGVVVKAPRY